MTNENTCSCSCNCNTGEGNSKCATNLATNKVYACGGASNVGVISFELAKTLHLKNQYKMGCTSGVAAGEFEVQNTIQQEGNQDLVIDGCPIACVQKIFEQKGIEGFKHIIVTEFGINKEAAFNFEPATIKQLIDKILH